MTRKEFEREFENGCDECRDTDGFCRYDSSCSGPHWNGDVYGNGRQGYYACGEEFKEVEE